MNENKGNLDNIPKETYLNGNNTENAEYTLKTGELGNKAVSAYKKIEDTVTGSYKKIEGTVVGSYKKIENKFVETFLEKK